MDNKQFSSQNPGIQKKLMGDTLIFGLTIFTIALYAIFVFDYLLITIIIFYILCLCYEIYSEKLRDYKNAFIYFLDTDISPIFPLIWVSLVLLSIVCIHFFLQIYDHWILKYLIYPVGTFFVLGNVFELLFYQFGLFTYSDYFLNNKYLNCIKIFGKKYSRWGIPYSVVLAQGLIFGPFLINLYYFIKKYWVILGIKQIYPEKAQFNYLFILILVAILIFSINKIVKISRQRKKYPVSYPRKRIHNTIPIVFLIIMISLTTVAYFTYKPIPMSEKVHTWSDGSNIYYNPIQEDKSYPPQLCWVFDNENTGLISNFRLMYLVHTIVAMGIFFLIFRKGFIFVNWVVYLKSFFTLYIFYWFFAWFLGLRGAWIYNVPTNIGVFYFSECIENLLWYYPLGFFSSFVLNNWMTKFPRTKVQLWSIYIGIPIFTFTYEFACVRIFKMWNFLPTMVYFRLFEYFTIEDWLFYTLFAWVSIVVIRYNERSLDILANAID